MFCCQANPFEPDERIENDINMETPKERATKRLSVTNKKYRTGYERIFGKEIKMQCPEIYKEMEELRDELSDNENAQNFVESVMEKAEDICANVERFDRESDAQVEAMLNMRDGMERWCKR